MEKRFAKIDEFINKHTALFLVISILIMITLIGLTLHGWYLVYQIKLNQDQDQANVSDIAVDTQNLIVEPVFEEPVYNLPVSNDEIEANLAALTELNALNSSSTEVMSEEDHEKALSALKAFEEVEEEIPTE